MQKKEEKIKFARRTIDEDEEESVCVVVLSFNASVSLGYRLRNKSNFIIIGLTILCLACIIISFLIYENFLYFIIIFRLLT